MTLKFTCIAFILCILPALLTASYPFKISVEIYGDQHLIGTPVMAKVTIQNATGELQRFNTAASEGKWYMGGKLCGVWIYPTAPPASDSQKPYVWEVPADWKAEFSYDLASRCELKSDGVYTLEYRYAKVDGTYWADPAQVDIQIQKPIGEDKEAYDSYQACLNLAQKRKDDSWHQCRAQLLADHPTSTYAAWAAFGDLESAQTWRKYEPYNIMRNSVPLQGGDRIAAEKQAAVMQDMIANRPDFPFMTDIKIHYCQWLWAVDRKAECIESLKTWAKDKDSDLSSWAKKYLDAAERRLKEGKK